MRAYVALVVCWALAAWTIYSGCYTIRFPDNYRLNPWVMKPRRLICNNVEGTAAFLILWGCLVFGFGLLILHAILTEPSGPLPPLP